MREELYVINGLVFIEGRVLIPKSLRLTVIEELHIGHQGVSSMKNNARQRFFWPGMGAQLQNRRNQCRRCNEIAPSNRQESPAPPARERFHVTDVTFREKLADISKSFAFLKGDIVR